MTHTRKAKRKAKSLKKTQLPLAPISRMMKECTGMLISEKAGKLMRKIVQETIERHALSAAEIGKVANKKTLTEAMLEVAEKNMKWAK